MIIQDYQGLWSKIQSFQFDEPDSKIRFSDKLAAQQNWNRDFTEKAIQEYRRFILLCSISPHGASPSEIVDEVWQLHLTYTRSYWTNLCKHVLEKDLHHHPSRGGPSEEIKRRNLYNQTLLLYQQVFDESPPEDIWPPPETSIPPLPDFDFTISRELFSITVLFLLIPFLITGISYGKLFPFFLNGPQFLEFYSLFLLAAVGSIILIQSRHLKAYKEWMKNYLPDNTNIFQVTRYLYGLQRGVQAALVDLIRRNLVEVKPYQAFVVWNSRYNTNISEINPLVPGLLKETNGASILWGQVYGNWAGDKAFNHPQWDVIEEFLNRKKMPFKIYWISLLAPAIGIIRLIQGMVNGKPVGYLFVLLILGIAVLLIIKYYCSYKQATFELTRTIYFGLPGTRLNYKDKVVEDFAYRGNKALQGYSDGLVLIATFDLFDKKLKVADTGFSNACGSSVSGGGSGGCSGGGGCGSGGCGGCGGGD